MNDRAEKVLKAILAKDLSSLTKDDKSFLRSRRSYLSVGEKKDYAKILEAKPKTKKK